MRINNNVMAMNTHRQYSVNNSNVAKATEKLSSGFRINRAGDDAAGLAISEKMRAQIRGLQMASKNSEDAISLVQTAEGALTETHSILQRMRELAVQSASATNDETVDRAALDAEFQELVLEIDDIAGKTAFNGKPLLNGAFGSSASVYGTSASDLRAGTAGITDVKIEGFAAGAFTVTFAADGTNYTATLSGDDADSNPISEVTVTLSQPADEPGTMRLDFGGGRSVTIQMNEHNADDFDSTTLSFTVSGTSAQIQTGANEGDQLSISINSMMSGDIGLTGISIGTDTNASSAITAVDNAINTVSTQRANLGAVQNRLEHKINNLDTSAENLQAAESRIRDLDMAKEMTSFTQNNILVQAATAMLAQANAAPQNVLSLLG